MTAALSWAYVVAVAVGWVVMREAGDRWWPATVLLYAPRWPWLLPAVVLVPLALLYRRRFLWLPMLTALCIVGPLMGLCLPWRAALAGHPAGQHLRLLSCNVHRHVDIAAFDSLLTREDPDVVVLQDYASACASGVLCQP